MKTVLDEGEQCLLSEKMHSWSARQVVRKDVNDSFTEEVKMCIISLAVELEAANDRFKWEECEEKGSKH